MGSLLLEGTGKKAPPGLCRSSRATCKPPRLVKPLDMSREKVGAEQASGEDFLRLLAELDGAPQLSPERLRFTLLTAHLSWGLWSSPCSFALEESVGETVGFTRFAN